MNNLINDANYRGFPAVSNSDLVWLEQYWQPPSFTIDLTRAYANGTLLDCMITEAHRVDYFKRTVVGEDYQFSQEEFECGKEMKKAFLKDEFCNKFLKQCSYQHISLRKDMPIQYEGFNFTLDAKCKWDLFRPDIDLSGDIKTTSATTLKQVQDAVVNFRYDQSRAWYMDIENRNNDILIFISKKNFKIFKVPIKRGDKIYTEGKKKYEENAFKWWYMFGKTQAAKTETARDRHIENFNRSLTNEEQSFDSDMGL